MKYFPWKVLNPSSLDQSESFYRGKGYSLPALLVVSVLALLLLTACGEGTKGMLETLKAIEESGYADMDASKATVEELKRGIELYKDVVAEKIKAAEQLSVYYKMLAMKYIDGEMFNLAREALVEAIQITPENAELFYLTGVCLGRGAKAEMNTETREKMYSDAEEYYKRALDLYPNHIEALYGLSILYIFEIDEPLEAEPYLLRLLDISGKDTDAMFLLARVYAYQGKFEEAVDLYEKIMRLSSDEEQKEKAKGFKEELTK